MSVPEYREAAIDSVLDPLITLCADLGDTEAEAHITVERADLIDREDWCLKLEDLSGYAVTAISKALERDAATLSRLAESTKGLQGSALERTWALAIISKRVIRVARGGISVTGDRCGHSAVD